LVRRPTGRAGVPKLILKPNRSKEAANDGPEQELE
jgi:hypothetical protein